VGRRPTLWVNLDLGCNTWTTRKLWLKGINSLAIETEEGKKARNFLQTHLTPCPFIIVKTYWRDKFNRYLADIFYAQSENDAGIMAEKGTYLNQELLDKNLARKYIR